MRAGFLNPLLQFPDRVFGVRNARTGEWVVARLESAFDSTTRRRGLLGRTGLDPGTGLVIAPTNAVHTFWMRFDIDVVFVRRDGRVVRVRRDVPPRRVAMALKAFAVIEVQGGSTRRLDIRPGDELRVEPVGA
jgi:uncharacterized membrane protein (UPF0127 family)